MSVIVVHQGHRMKIAVTPMQTMKYVIEEACSKRNLQPNRMILVHRNTTLDLSLPFRYTGVSNNAVLDLKPKTTTDDQIRVCVQSSSNRKQGTFQPSSTLAHVLEHIGFQIDSTTQLIFMQREIQASEFQTTTLTQLGLCAGSAMFRLRNTALSTTPTLQPVESKQTIQPPPHPIESKPMPQPAPITLPQAVESKAIESKPKRHVHFEQEAVSMDVEQALSSFDAIQKLRDNAFDADSRTAILTLMKILCNILSKPEKDDPRVRSIRLGNPAFHRNVGRLEGGHEFLNAIGFTATEDGQHVKLTKENRSRLQDAWKVLQKEANDLNIDPAQRPVAREPVEPDVAFDPFKTVIIRQQAQPRGGKSSVDVKLDKLKQKEAELLAIDPPKRNTIVLFPGQGTKPTEQIDSAGSSDSKLIVQALKRKQLQQEKAQNFQTRAMRELDQLSKKKVFTQVIVRVHFPDRVILQAHFHPNETIEAIAMEICANLRPEYQSLEFALSVSPPMRRLDHSMTLSAAGLVPAARIYLSWTTSPSELNGRYLIDTLIANDKAASMDKEEAMNQYPHSIPMQKIEQEKTQIKAESKSKKKPNWLKL